MADPVSRRNSRTSPFDLFVSTLESSDAKGLRPRSGPGEGKGALSEHRGHMGGRFDSSTLALGAFERPLRVARVGQDHDWAGGVVNRSHARGSDELVVHGAVSVAAEHHQLRVQGRRTQALAARRRAPEAAPPQAGCPSPRAPGRRRCPGSASRDYAQPLGCSAAPMASGPSHAHAVTTRSLQLPADCLVHGPFQRPLAGCRAVNATYDDVLASVHDAPPVPRSPRPQLCSWGDRLSTRPRNSRPGLDRLNSQADPDVRFRLDVVGRSAKPNPVRTNAGRHP